MKKRRKDSEIEKAKKKSSTGLFVIILLFLMLLLTFCFVFFLYDKGMIYLKNGSKKQQNTEEKTKNKKVVIPKNVIDVDKDDVHVLQLFRNVAVTSNQCSGYHLQDSVSVTNMSVECKFGLASHLYLEKIKERYAYSVYIYVNEDDVKEAYESIFGNGTYKQQDKIPYHSNDYLIYNASDRVYFIEYEPASTSSTIISYEKILSVKKSEDMLYITSGVVYYETVNMVFCKDSKCNEVIENVQNEPSYPDYYKLYVDYHKDDLYQYIYQFKMNDFGFYQYVGFERA